MLLARVRAAPVDGAANEALVRLLADRLGVPRSAVAIVSGKAARSKRVRVDGAGAASVGRTWPGLRLG